MAYQCDLFIRLDLDIHSDEPKVLHRMNMPLRDAQGNMYHSELWSINPNYFGKEYCYAYAMAEHILSSPHIDDVGIIKIDTCAARDAVKNNKSSATTVVSLYYEKDRYTGEPVFVANPQGVSEDDGVVLVVTRYHDESALLVLDAKSMKSVAKINAPFPLMFEFHGQFFTS